MALTLVTPVLPSPDETRIAIAGLLMVATTMDVLGIENGAEANRQVAGYLAGFSQQLRELLTEKLRLQKENEALHLKLMLAAKR